MEIKTKYSVVNIQTVLYLCSTFVNFLASVFQTSRAEKEEEEEEED